MTKDEALKHHAEKYGVSLKQFKTMCNNASKHYENQGMNSVDYGLAREAYFAGFTDACKEALEQPLTRDWKDTIDERIARDSEFKEALEQPNRFEGYETIEIGHKKIAQEPVYQVYSDWCCKVWEDCDKEIYDEAINPYRRILYTHPHQWQGLTDDEINEIVRNVSDDMYPWKGNMLIGKIIRAIEQALREKNNGI
jgi:hypothetical protein